MPASSPARLQPVTPELHRWITDQLSAGHSQDVVLQSMLASGWHPEVARRAVDDMLRKRPAASAVQMTTSAVQVPEPLPVEGASVLWAGDREVKVLLSLRRPRIVLFGGLLSDEECDEMMALAGARLSRSETVELATGANEVNSARTSEGMFFGRAENPLCARIEARIAALTQWPVENGEGLQVLRYAPGAEYKPHHDYFDVSQPGTPAVLRRGGQRVATIVTYLNSPRRGGATVFPEIELDIAPVKGNAVFFSYDRPHPDTGTLHGGAPVLEGEKWVATKWLRETRFD